MKSSIENNYQIPIASLMTCTMLAIQSTGWDVTPSSFNLLNKNDVGKIYQTPMSTLRTTKGIDN
jgi:hypothetical protein